LLQAEAEVIGIDKFLPKPVKLTDLVKLLSSIFEKPDVKKEPLAGITRIGKKFKNRKILVAEDNPLNMMLISAVLDNMGFDVVKASNGEEAIAMLRQDVPGIIFMDVNMPVMDGYTATQKIRRSPDPFRDIPIIALTADAMKEDKERCLKAGMNDFISKPFQLSEIENIMNSYGIRK
jgi:CheY-like chemotaxis protein